MGRSSYFYSLSATVILTTLLVLYFANNLFGVAKSDSYVITMGLQRVPPSLSLDNLKTIEDYEILSKMHLSLMSQDTVGRIYPAAAKKWTVIRSGEGFIFELRQDLKFSSGDALTCQDVVETFDFLRQRSDRSLWALNLISKIKCLSTHELQVELTQANPFFLAELADIRYSIRHRPLTESSDKIPHNGLGLYDFHSLDPKTHELHLTLKQSHPQKIANMPGKVVFKTIPDLEHALEHLEAGQLDIYPLRGQRMKPSKLHVVESERKDRVWTLIVSPKLKVRGQSMAGCINRWLSRPKLVSDIGERFYSETASMIPFTQEVLSDFPSNTQLATACESRKKLKMISMDHIDDSILNSTISHLHNVGLRSLNAVPLSKAKFMEAFETGEYDLALYSIGITPSAASDLAFFYSRNPTFPPSRWVDLETVRLATRLVSSRSEMEANDIKAMILARAFNIGPYVALFFENERYLMGNCVYVTDPHMFHLNNQFKSIAKSRTCFD